MKLFALIAALARAEEDDNQWNGVRPENLCGKHISFEDESLVNRTCTWTGNNVVHAFAGNGAFISGTVLSLFVEFQHFLFTQKEFLTFFELFLN